MLNREKFATEILDIVCNGNKIAVVDGKPRECSGVKCNTCGLEKFGSCYDGLRDWANSEYVEPPVDWSKVPVDTPILVKDSGDTRFSRRYFAKFENGVVYAWDDGKTSWSDAGSINVSAWECAKLAESEESHD